MTNPWRAYLAVSCVMLAAVALLVLGVAWVRDAPALADALIDLPAPVARRCAHCAWIESKREVRPGTYEYTTRMVDGSSSVFLETLPITWRVGERMMIIGGAGR